MTSPYNRRDFLKTLGAASLAAGPLLNGCGRLSSSGRKPNVVIIFADDLGYGDIGVYGHPTINTPHLDRMAAEGQKWTNFYVAASVCTPSRAGLLTGRLPVRSGMCSDVEGVLYPNSTGGLPANEVTMAEALKSQDYATACVGKWHLGHLPPYLPTANGFDSYFGIPYSNDMCSTRPDWPDYERTFDPKSEYWNVPLMRNEEIVERPTDQTSLTRRYTEEAVRFIQNNIENPFFLYLAHNMPHIPLFASDSFDGKSRRGLYGDVIEEIDWSVGQVLSTLRKEGLAENTLVVFTSDNGPWLYFLHHGGSAGLLREGKDTAWEGGFREPGLFWWPGTIRPGVVSQMGSTLDLFPTVCHLAGVEIPDDRIMDGLDLRPALLGSGKSPRDTMFYYIGTRLYAVRKGPFKAHFTTITEPFRPGSRSVIHDPPLLFNLEHDPSEKYDVAADHPDVIADIINEVERHKANLVPGEDQLAKR